MAEQRVQTPPEASARVTVRMIGEAEDASPWQAYVESSPQATIYHDNAWREIFALSLGYQSFELIALDAGNGACRGALRLFRVPSLTGRPRLVALPFRDRGGVLFEDAAAFQALFAEADKVRRQSGAAFVELKTIEPYPAAACETAGLIRRDYWVHSETDLSPFTAQTLPKALGEKTRNMIRQAEQAGLQVVEADEQPHYLDAWFGIYERSQQSLGLPAFPRAFFERMLALLQPRGLARLFLVEDRDGRAVAGMIVLVERSRVIYAYSASDRRGRDLRANDLMLFRLMNWSMERGLTRLDFGSDSPLQAGLLFFKSKWLARQTPIAVYYLGDAPARPTDSSSAGYAAIRAAVRYMPLPLSRAVLTPLVRYFG